MRICSHCETQADTAWCAVDGHPTYQRVARSGAELADGALIAGAWRVTGVLGRGGFATVYDARCERTDKGVAVKVIRPLAQASRDEVLARFRREARVSSQLAHPNTVQVFEHGELPGGRLFLAMERLPGESLRTMLSNLLDNGFWLAPLHVVQIAISVLRSLEEAHGLGLVHRDLKPGNVFMVRRRGGDWTPKVLDFGLVQAPGSQLTRAGQALGTPWYMSPEQVRGERVDGRSDLYSLGIVLYECLAGRPPFVSDNTTGVLLQQLESTPMPLSERAGDRAPAALAAVVERALLKAPDDRWPDAPAMRAALDAVLPALQQQLPPPGTPSGLIEGAKVSASRRGTAAYGVAVLDDETLDGLEVPDSEPKPGTRSTQPTQKLTAAQFERALERGRPQRAASKPTKPAPKPSARPSTHRAVQAVDLAAIEAEPIDAETRLDHALGEPRAGVSSGRLRLHFARADPQPDHGARRRKHLAITGKPPPR